MVNRTNRDIPAENVEVLVRNMKKTRETYTGDGRELHVTYAVDNEGVVYGFRECRTNLAGARIVYNRTNPCEKLPRARRFASAPDLVSHTKLSPKARVVLKETLKRYNQTRPQR